MSYYRTIKLDTEVRYWFVDMGPIPDVPDWHVQSRGISYPFPTELGAFRFALFHKNKDPDRNIVIRTPDGDNESVELPD